MRESTGASVPPQSSTLCAALSTSANGRAALRSTNFRCGPGLASSPGRRSTRASSFFARSEERNAIIARSGEALGGGFGFGFGFEYDAPRPAPQADADTDVDADADVDVDADVDIDVDVDVIDVDVVDVVDAGGLRRDIGGNSRKDDASMRVFW